MDKLFKIVIWGIAIAGVSYLLWQYVLKPKPKCNTCNGLTTVPADETGLTSNGDGETPTDDSSGKVIEEEGETSVNIDYGVDYKRNSVNKYYLVYRDFKGGAGQVVEITGTAYLQYMKDYPSGVAKGNVIVKYKV